MPDRRSFLQTSLAAFLALTHGPIGLAGVRSRREERPVRFAAIHLCSGGLDEMSSFYVRTLGLVREAQSATAVTLRAGRSTIRFDDRQTPDAAGAVYHFAFNIPENMIRTARTWLLQRGVPIISAPEHLRDPDFPDDVVHFRHWDAHSLFFWDPAGNMVEFIARHTLDNAVDASFDESHILGVSELAFVTDDVKPLARSISKQTNLDLYGSISEQFAAVGDEYGLLLVMRTGRRMGFGAGPGLKSHPAEAIIRDPLDDTIRLDDLPYTIRAMPAADDDA